MMLMDMFDFYNVRRQFTPTKAWAYKDPVTNELKGMALDVMEKRVDIGGILIKNEFNVFII